MAFFSRKVTTAEFAPSPLKAAAGVGISGIPGTYAWTSGAFEQVALSLPTVSRARDLLASTISGLEFRQYVKQWNAEALEHKRNLLAQKEKDVRDATGIKDRIQNDIDQKEKACNDLRTPVATRAAA